MRDLKAGSLALVLVVVLCRPVAAAAASPVLRVTVHTPSPEVRTLVLRPGGMLTIRFDRAVQRVEASDPSLLDISLGGWHFRDVVLRARAGSGEATVHVWAGELLVGWRVVITRALPQTAEFVVVAAAGPRPSMGPAVGVDARAQAAPGGRSVRAEAEKSGIRLVMEVIRNGAGLAVRYRVANSSAKSFFFEPSRSVVWLDGRAVQFALVREVSTADPSVLMPGAVETGVLTVAGSGNVMRILLALRPDEPGKTEPLWFDCVFTGLQALREQR